MSPSALIVEDHVDSAIIFAEALREAGFEAESIRAGDTALARLAATTPDVVVLDLSLPRVTGRDILRQIRSDPRLASTCVIVATAYPRLAEGVEDEADLVLIKPVSFSQLRSLVTQLPSSASP